MSFFRQSNTHTTCWAPLGLFEVIPNETCHKPFTMRQTMAILPRSLSPLSLSLSALLRCRGFLSSSSSCWAMPWQCRLKSFNQLCESCVQLSKTAGSVRQPPSSSNLAPSSDARSPVRSVRSLRRQTQTATTRIGRSSLVLFSLCTQRTIGFVLDKLTQFSPHSNDVTCDGCI